MDTTLQQGQNLYRNGQYQGVVQYDSRTGQRLGAGQTTSLNSNGFNLSSTPNFGQTVNAQNTAPLTSLSLPDTPASTAIAGAQGRIDAQTGQTSSTLDQYIINQNEQAKNASSQSDTDYKQTVNDILGVQNQRASLNQEQDIAGKTAAINTARQQVTNYNNQLIQEQAALNRQIEAIQNRSGSTVEGNGAAVAEVQRESLRKQADISLLKLTADASLNNANLDLSTAKSIIDDKINVQLEPLQTKLNYQQAFMQRNWNKLDSSEKDIMSQMQTESQRDYETTKSNLQDANKYWLDAAQSGANAQTLSSIQQAINSGNYAQAKSLSSPYLSSANNEIVDINGQKVLINKRTGQQIRSYGGGSSGILSTLNASRGNDGYTNTDLYANQRASSGMSANEFDNKFGYLLNPNARQRLGVATGAAGGSVTKEQISQHVYQQMNNSAWTSASDDQKRAYIQSLGGNPTDFGL